MNKIAIVSDIYNNALALKAVLDDIKNRQIQTIINIGDSLYGVVNPKETLHLLNTNNIININGNRDRQIYETLDTIEDNLTLKFIIDDIGDEGLSWLKQLPFDHRIEDVYFWKYYQQYCM